MEERDSWDAITFMNNTPAGIDWTRIVLTKDTEVGRIKGGSAFLYNPEKYTSLGWLTCEKASEILKKHTGRRKKFKDKEQAALALWKYFKPKAKKPVYEDFSPYHLKKIGKWKDENGIKYPPTTEPPKNLLGADMTKQVEKRKRVAIPSDAKIGTTGKQPKSEKNIARIKLYRRSKVSTILSKNLEITLADIKYDIKRGYAEIVG